MKLQYLMLFMICISHLCAAQYKFEPSASHPYGLPNPEAPKEILDFAPLIGTCDCSSQTRNQDQTWQPSVTMTWKFKYIMNGMAVQDETLKADGRHSGSIRQFIADSSRWYVHYYSSASPSTLLPKWEGTKHQDGKIVLYREQKAPNGMEGYYRLSFYDIDDSGFQWIGEWTSKDESIIYPTWKIRCKKRKNVGNKEDKDKIMGNSKKFSEAYINADYESMTNIYTTDASIFPPNTLIIKGKKAIKKRWILPKGTTVLHHEINSEALEFIGDYAYDYGYYEGKTRLADRTESTWKGKYVVVWKKENNDWKMYLDIWNRVE